MNITLPPLYAKDSKGRTKFWSVMTESNPDGTATYTVVHGLDRPEAKKQSSPKLISVGKNIGKSNETTPYEQACSEAQSKWNKQIDKGYVENKFGIPMPNELPMFLPMLAHKWDDKGGGIVFPAYVQPKLDGFRCVSGRRVGPDVTLWTRLRKEIKTLTEISSELESIIPDKGCLDGELYIHEWRSPSNEPDFQRISSAIKRRKADTKQLEYHVYDRPVPENPGLSFYERFYKPAFEDKTLVGTEHVKIVPTHKINSEEEMFEFFEKWTSGELPYEGLMIRNENGVYLYDNRSSDLLKVKDFQEDEYEIVGGKEGTGRDRGTVIFIVQKDDGVEFESRPVGTYEQRSEYYENLNSYIGKYLRVRFNGLTSAGIPRFNRGVGIRESWDM
jgi:DNA ligase-1